MSLCLNIFCRHIG